MESLWRCYIVDMGNGFSLIKLSNVIDRNKVLQGQPWFVGGQIYYLQAWKTNFDPVKEKLILLCCGFVYPVYP